MLSVSFDGAILSRAFLAVQIAAADDDHRPVLHRAVRVEHFTGRGARLIATDGYWVATCWVPELDEVADEPDPWELPDHAATISDGEWRLRDLMKHVARLTRDRDGYVPGSVEVHVVLDEPHYDPDAPTLSIDLAPNRALVELPGKERVYVHQIDADYPDWRSMWARIERSTGESPAAHRFSAWMLDRFAKVAHAAGGDAITFEWSANGTGFWTANNSTRLEHPPHGIVQTASVPGSALHGITVAVNDG